MTTKKSSRTKITTKATSKTAAKEHESDFDVDSDDVDFDDVDSKDEILF
jgi:hypothetical protein